MLTTTHGFITVPRLDLDLLGDEQETTQTNRGAWHWLFDKAAWKAHTERFGRFTVDLRRGEIACSYRFLARAWNWSHGRVQRWIKTLADRRKITVRTDAGILVIGLHGYDRCPRTESVCDAGESPKGNGGGHSRPVDEQQPSQRRIQEQNTEVYKRKGDLARCARSEEDKAHAERCALEIRALSKGKTVERQIHDERAYAAAMKEEKFQRWLNGLEICAGALMAGTERACELGDLIQRARKAGYGGKDPVFMRPLNEFARRIFAPWRATERRDQRDAKEQVRRLLGRLQCVA